MWLNVLSVIFYNLNLNDLWIFFQLSFFFNGFSVEFYVVLLPSIWFNIGNKKSPLLVSLIMGGE